ncbi:hypothetical protein MNB_SV-4-1169 [hydrothermal vent metagenome]|uniref:Porin domain-containing protein n=1 Tax=hydrothermal vent metagenome TaxID=652676 RepID=A0A1W1E7U6_9ZZZZ
MKNPIILILISFAWLGAVDFTGSIDIAHSGYSHASDETETSGYLEFGNKNTLFESKMKCIYLYSDRYEERRYFYLNELFAAKNTEDYRFEIGKRIIFWGELEGYNITDIFNQKNYLLDPFDKSAKLGSWSGTLSRYFGDDLFEAGVKFYEENLDLSDPHTPYYPLPIPYSSSLNLQEGRYTPTLYLSYTLTSEKIVESESRIILWHGYDNKRNFIPIEYGQRLAQYAYRVNKALFLSHIVYEDMIFKLEGSYTHIIDYAPMSDYGQFGVGAEKSLYDIGGTDVTFYTEYYRYIYKDDTKVKNVDISEIYNDDLFLAAKLNFNDTRSSELRAGMLYDLGNSEKVFKVEAKMRLLDRFVLHALWLHILPDDNTLLSAFEDHTRITFGIRYTF